ncbi:MAG: DNA polymerase I, partial [Candidatus Electryonea clarkiae]|nr:DNA polymerase I [Candidatus Electryonea clarkiae]
SNTAPIAENIEDLNFGPLDTKEARKLFTELEFKRLLNYLDKGKKVLPPEERKVVYKSVVNESELMSMIKKLSKSPRIAIDTETTSIDPNQAELVGLSFSSKQGDAYYIPVNYFSFSDQDEISGEGRPLSDCGDTTERLLERLRTLLEIGPGKIAQNAKYDFLLLKRYGIQVNPLVFDPMLADYLINPGARGHSIDAMALNYLNIKKIETAELIGKGKSQVTMDRVPLEIITKYACEDAEVAFALSEVLEHRIEEEELSDLLREIELPVSHVLMEMEYNGIKLELNSLGKMSKEMNEQISELEAECHLLAGIEFNLNSTQELSHILFDKLNMSTKLSRKTKTGFYSTDQSVLERLAPIDPLPKKLLEHRSLRKLVSTYVDALPKLVNQRTGRLHTTYNQTVAATGRLSSNNPNLQNIPIRSDMGAEIRRAFIAEQDHLLLSADYSQVELRMMAHLSNDAGLIEAFENGEDIHRTTASKVFNVTPEHVSVQQRSAAKAVNFGVLFGMREFGLSSRLGISKKQAKEFIDGYFGAYPKVEVFIKNLLDQARSDGYVKTILGRRRPIPDLVSSNRNVMQGAERAAIATAVQGSAADLIKVAMIRLQRDLDQGKHPFKMLLQVHDELIFEVHEDVVEEAAAWAKDKMETAMKLSVPLIVDTGWGKNWLEAH